LLTQVPSQRDSDYAAQRFFLLNNVPCVVAGANLHEHDARRGKTVSQETMLTDLVLMKQNNFNAVRMCHYPHAHRLYELCDELGLMVCDEANIETHGFALSFQLSFVATHPAWEGALMQRVKNMALRARNYASVVTWSLGNESGCGTFHEKAAAWIRAFDPTRTLQYEGGRDHGDAVMILGNGRGSERVTDFVCPMYDSPNDMGAHARNPKETRPGVLCEYAHAMGNSTGGLHVYWDGFWEFEDVSLRSLQGGYMWDWVDQGLLLGADGLREGHGGDFGPGSGTGDAQFCLNGIVAYNRVPHPGIVEFKHCQSPVAFSLQSDLSPSLSSKGDMTVVIKNRYRDLDLSHLVFKYSVIGGSDETGEVVECAGQLKLTPKKKNSGSPADDDAFFFPGGEFVAVVPRPAGGRAVLAIDLIAELCEDTDWADRGHVVARDRLRLVSAKLRRRSSVALKYPLAGADKVKIIHDDKIKVVLAPKYRAGFDESGNLVMLNQFLSKEAEGMAVSSHCFMRAATDNDNGGLSSEGMGSSVVPFLKAADAVFGSTLTTDGLTALSYAATWLEEGLTNCVHVPMMQTWSERELMTTTSIRREGDAGDAKQKKSPNELFRVETKWTFRDDDITVTVRVVVGPALVSSRIHSIPRVGMRFALDKSFGRVQWHGCGPEECYPDRKRGSPEGVYETDVDKMHVSYTVPGECGGRADVRWVRMMRDAATADNGDNDDDDEGKGDGGVRNKSILFRYEQMDAVHAPDEVPLSGHSLIGRKQEPTTIRPAGSEGAQISVSRFSRQELHRKKHDWELRTSNSIYLHIDTVHMGLGGDNSWTPGVHQQYQINADTEGAEWNYRLTLIPE
jgi:beta-galactosidase